MLLHLRQVVQVRFPYVTGLLGFREIPMFLSLLAAIDRRVDAVLVDGQGIAHPKRLGAAAHLALWLAESLPVVGVAKSRLIGSHEVVPDTAGASVPLVHRGEIVGTVLRSRGGCRPLYVSPGGNVDVAGALRLVVQALAGHRLPEPVHLADRLTKEPPLGGYGLNCFTGPALHARPP